MGREGERGQRVRYICESCRQVIEELEVGEAGLLSLGFTVIGHSFVQYLDISG